MKKEMFKEVRELSKPGFVTVGTVDVFERKNPQNPSKDQTVLTCSVDGVVKHTKVLGPHSSQKLLVANAKKRTRRMLRKVVQLDKQAHELAQ